MGRRLEFSRGDAMAVSENSQHAMEGQLNRVEHRIRDKPIVVEAANAQVKAWLDGKQESFDAVSCRLEGERQVHQLNAHADDAEAYGAALFVLAAAAAEERCMLLPEALLARNDANVAAMVGN